MSDGRAIRLSIIGATGSVGSSVLRICRLFPDKFHIHSLCAQKNVERMRVLSEEFHPEKVLMTDANAASHLDAATGGSLHVLAGIEHMDDLVADDEVDQVIFASSGTDAIPSLQKALIADKNISLANKESIVVAGPWIMPLVRRTDQLRPLDSEHNAIWQCLKGEDNRKVAKICLTASGGPFRNLSIEELRNVTPAMAVRHPVWQMGSKVSVDSSTLMNKGIELIEAANLFAVPPSQVTALIHPSSLIHGIVEFSDHTFKMLASYPDMSLPAATAMAFPERLVIDDSSFGKYNPVNTDLHFEEPDMTRFPCLRLAMEAAAKGGPYPALLVGADEVAVNSFLQGRISFPQIAEVVEKVMESWKNEDPRSLEEALDVLSYGRLRAESAVLTQTR